MKNKHFNDVAKKLKDQYHVNVLEDILLARQDSLTLFADRTHLSNIVLEVISGSLEYIGFSDQKSIKLSEILNAFDYDNKYGQIAGKIEYYEEIFSQINDFSEPKDISFPVISQGSRRWLRFNIFPSLSAPQISVFTISDVTRLHTQEEETFAKTHLDSLTELYNKYAFDHHYGRKYLTPGFHVMYMDLDNFKEINDSYGHAIGNKCLRAFADVLKKFENSNNSFYRIGGDEFIGLLIGSSIEINNFAQKIIEQVRNIEISDISINLTVSMGIMKASKSIDLARKADDLMYTVKKSGKNNYLYKTEED